MTRNNHYIIVGLSALASNSYHELIARQQQVTLILRSQPDKAALPTTEEIDIVLGDGSDLETLREAGGEKAKAILALLNDDSANAFAILAAKELNAKAKTVAAVQVPDGMLLSIRTLRPGPTEDVTDQNPLGFSLVTGLSVIISLLAWVLLRGQMYGRDLDQASTDKKTAVGRRMVRS